MSLFRLSSKDVTSKELLEPSTWPETYCLIEISEDCSKHAVMWLMSKLEERSIQDARGAGCIVKLVNDEISDKPRWIYVSATGKRVLEAAEWAGVQKHDFSDGLLRRFHIDGTNTFVGEGEDPAELFTMAERARLILAEISRLRVGSNEDETHAIYHTDNCRFHPEQCIIPKMIRKGLIRQILPIHDKEQRKKLYEDWVMKFTAWQPLNDVRNYFGENIAMFFGFYGFLNYHLLWPAAIGAFIYFAKLEDHPPVAIFYSTCNVVFIAVLLEKWKRYEAELAYRWGTIKFDEIELPRPAFRGKMSTNPVTGRVEPHYPTHLRGLRVGLFSMPIIASLATFAIWIMFKYYEYEFYCVEIYNADKTNQWKYFLVYVPSIVYAIVVSLATLVYRSLATWLTDKENWRLESEYKRQLVVKLLVFDSINCFSSLFYVAFYLRNMALLRKTLFSLLTVSMMLNQVPEIIMPYLLTKQRHKAAAKKKLDAHQAEFIDPDDKDFSRRHARAVYEADKEKYWGSFDDYAEIFVQFGYIFLFSSAFPIAALLAVIINGIEIRSDAFKLCKVLQRPFAEPVPDIGVYHYAFEALGIIAIMTNCALIALSEPVLSYFPDLTDTKLVIGLVAIEHLLILMHFALSMLVSDIPVWIKVNLAKEDFQSRQALKKLHSMHYSGRFSQLIRSNRKLKMESDGNLVADSFSSENVTDPMQSINESEVVK